MPDNVLASQVWGAAGYLNSTQRRTRSASAVLLNLPAESKNTITSFRPAILACITKH
jgi:hypothetical protein